MARADRAVLSADMASWPCNMAAPQMPMPSAPSAFPVMPDPAALLEMQRQQAESQYLQAYQHFAALSELSRQTQAQADAADAAQAPQEQKKPEEKKEERTPVETEKPAAASAREEAKEHGGVEKQENKNVVPPDVAEKPDEANKGQDAPPPKVIYRIRKVGTYSCGDGCLEIFARWTPDEERDRIPISDEVKISQSRPVRDENKASAVAKEASKDGEMDYLRPTPKKMPVSSAASASKEVKEPNYPPQHAIIQTCKMYSTVAV